MTHRAPASTRRRAIRNWSFHIGAASPSGCWRADAVAVAEPGVLAADVQRPGDLVRGQHVEGAAIDVVHAADLGVVDRRRNWSNWPSSALRRSNRGGGTSAGGFSSARSSPSIRAAWYAMAEEARARDCCTACAA